MLEVRLSNTMFRYNYVSLLLTIIITSYVIGCISEIIIMLEYIIFLAARPIQLLNVHQQNWNKPSGAPVL